MISSWLNRRREPSEAAYLSDRVLASLEDGEWHDLDDISERVQLASFQVKEFLLFLSEFNFVELDVERWRVRTSPAILRWLGSLQQEEI